MTWRTTIFESGTTIVQNDAARDCYWYVYAGTAPTEWERNLVRYRVADQLADWLNNLDEQLYPFFHPHWAKSLRHEGNSLLGDYGIKLIATVFPRLKKDESGREIGYEDETDADVAAKQALIDRLLALRSPA